MIDICWRLKVTPDVKIEYKCYEIVSHILLTLKQFVFFC